MSTPRSFDGPGWLSSHVNLESLNVPVGSRRGPPTLDRISTLMQYLGSPELEFPAIHITGTNGTFAPTSGPLAGAQFTGGFTKNTDGSVTFAGTWSISNSGYSGSGTINATRPAP